MPNKNTSSVASVQSIVHTPGPWNVNYRRVTPVNGKQDGTDDICHVYGDEDKEIANAKLIAAAPELLAACELVALWMLGGQPGPHSDSIVLDQVKLAIQKAKS